MRLYTSVVANLEMLLKALLSKYGFSIIIKYLTDMNTITDEFLVFVFILTQLLWVFYKLEIRKHQAKAYFVNVR